MIVIVNFNSGEVLKKCVDYLGPLSDMSWKIRIVDNNSSDDSLNFLKGVQYDHIDVVSADRNRGFGSAVNRGFRDFNGVYGVILNPDVMISERTMQDMAAYMDSRQEVGALGPRLVSETGQVTRSTGVVPDLHRILFNRLDNDYRTHNAESLQGACIMVRMTAYQEAEGFDERYFLYNEDVDLCLRLRRAGYLITYNADFTAVHSGGHSTAGREWIRLEYARSMLMFADIHFGRSTLWAYRALYLARGCLFLTSRGSFIIGLRLIQLAIHRDLYGKPIWNRE